MEQSLLLMSYREYKETRQYKAGLKISRSDPGLYQTCFRSDTGKTIRKAMSYKPGRALNKAIRPAFASSGLMRL